MPLRWACSSTKRWPRLSLPPMHKRVFLYLQAAAVTGHINMWLSQVPTCNHKLHDSAVWQALH